MHYGSLKLHEVQADLQNFHKAFTAASLTGLVLANIMVVPCANRAVPARGAGQGFCHGIACFQVSPNELFTAGCDDAA